MYPPRCVSQHSRFYSWNGVLNFGLLPNTNHPLSSHRLLLLPTGRCCSILRPGSRRRRHCIHRRLSAKVTGKPLITRLFDPNPKPKNPSPASAGVSRTPPASRRAPQRPSVVFCCSATASPHPPRLSSCGSLRRMCLPQCRCSPHQRLGHASSPTRGERLVLGFSMRDLHVWAHNLLHTHASDDILRRCGSTHPMLFFWHGFRVWDFATR